MKNSFFSIILPVYNSENYLERAIRSVCNQSYKNWELIIINDGSTDNSISICEKYNFEEKKIHLINQKNAGVSCARNRGINFASGKYVLFLDSDDWLEIDCLEIMNEKIDRTDADLLIFNYFTADENNKDKDRDITQVGQVDKEELLNNSVRQYQWQSPKWTGNLHTVWGKCFKKEIISKYNLEFDFRLKIGEDMIFVLSYISHSKHIYCFNDYLYNYYSNEFSVMHNRKWEGVEPGQLYFNLAESVVQDVVSESAKADLWMEILESDWETIVNEKTSFKEKYSLLSKLFKSQLYFRFSKKTYAKSNKKQEVYCFAIRHHMVQIAILLTYYRIKKNT